MVLVDSHKKLNRIISAIVAATRRLQQLVSAGPFTLAGNPNGRDEDRYGRKLRIVTRGGESLGGVLVDEGLARWYAGRRQGWLLIEFVTPELCVWSRGS